MSSVAASGFRARAHRGQASARWGEDFGNARSPSLVPWQTRQRCPSRARNRGRAGAPVSGIAAAWLCGCGCGCGCGCVAAAQIRWWQASDVGHPGHVADRANFVVVRESGEYELYLSRFGAVGIDLDLLAGPAE